jgi:hypothetical protein
MTWGRLPTPCDGPRRSRGDDEGHGKTMSHRTARESPPCLQGRHNWHSSNTPPHAMTWAEDHDDNHAQTYATPRQDGVPCKPSYPSKAWDSWIIHSGSPPSSFSSTLLPLPLLLHPHCKNFKAFKRGTHTRSSLRLDVGLCLELV